MRYFTRSRGSDVVDGPYEIQELCALVAQSGLSPADLVLLDEGISQEQLREYWTLQWQPIASVVGFEKLVMPVASEPTFCPEASSHESKSLEHMRGGAVICALGLVVTGGSYLMASADPNGGSYFLAYGAIIGGAVTFLRGFLRFH